MGATKEETYVAAPAAPVEAAETTDGRAMDAARLQLDYEEQQLDNCQLKRHIAALEDRLEKARKPLADQVTGDPEGDVAAVLAQFKDFLKIVYLFDRQYDKARSPEEAKHLALELVQLAADAASHIGRTLVPSATEESEDLSAADIAIRGYMRREAAFLLAAAIMAAVDTSRAYNIDLVEGLKTLIVEEGEEAAADDEAIGLAAEDEDKPTEV